MRDQDDVSQCRMRPRARAGREQQCCEQAALTGLSLPSMPSRRSRKSLCPFTAPSAVSAALLLPRCGTPPLPHPPSSPHRECAEAGSVPALGRWIPTQVGLNFTPPPVPVPVPILPLVSAGVSLLSPCPTVCEPSRGAEQYGRGAWGGMAMGLVRTVPRGAWVRGSEAGEGATQWGTGRGVWGIWGGSSVCPNLCLSFPFCNHARAMHSPVLSQAQFSAAVPSPRPCPLCSSMPLCLAIALSPAWVDVTVPKPRLHPRPVLVLHCPAPVPVPSMAQCQCAPS